jgi:hypothetical protein
VNSGTDTVSFSKSRLRLKCDGTRAQTRFRLSAKRMSPFKSAGASVQSTTGSRGVCISGSNAGYTIFRGSVKSTGYPLHSPVFPLLPLPCVTACHHISTGLYAQFVVSNCAVTLYCTIEIYHRHQSTTLDKTLTQIRICCYFLINSFLEFHISVNFPYFCILSAQFL